MTATIVVNKLVLCHKGDADGFVTATVPDYCKTPADGKPVAYPNTAHAVDLATGTTTVSADGGFMVAHKASIFQKSEGDELGTLGGVTSGVNLAEATWLSYSMDVFAEGLNVCRLTDQMQLNHGNTVSQGGYVTKLKDWLKGPRDCEALMKMIEEIAYGVKKMGTTWSPDARGLLERIVMQIFGSMGPSDPVDRPDGTNGWDRHNDEIEDVQKRLRDHIDEYDKNCPKGPKVPSHVEDLATRKAPTPQEHRGPITWRIEVRAPAPVDWVMVGNVVAVVAVAALFVAAVIFFPVTATAAAAAVVVGVVVVGAGAGSTPSGETQASTARGDGWGDVFA